MDDIRKTLSDTAREMAVIAEDGKPVLLQDRALRRNFARKLRRKEKRRTMNPEEARLKLYMAKLRREEQVQRAVLASYEQDAHLPGY